MLEEIKVRSWIAPVAKMGLIAKGLVYCLVGILAFMSAFELGNKQSDDADKKGVFNFIQHQWGGKALLAMIILGLLCYAIWRLVQAIADTENKGKDVKGISRRLRYVFSGLIYSSLAMAGVKMLLHRSGSGSDNSNETMVSELLQKPFGQWLVGIVAAMMAGNGIYQLYYGFSEKYRKHIRGLHIDSTADAILTRSGKIGYSARGIVWLLIAWLIIKAAIHANAAEAGDTATAFQFLENGAYGSMLLGALGFGLLCYGVYNFIRARYDHFG